MAHCYGAAVTLAAFRQAEPRIVTVTLCKVEQIPEAGALEVDAPDGLDTLVLMRFGGQVYAYLNVCPHAGRPLNWAPGKFLLAHGQLVCAAHGAAFKPEDGSCIGGPCRGESLTAIPITIEDGEVRLAQSAC